MYKKQPFYTVRSIRFRRWSRKSYACFSQLEAACHDRLCGEEYRRGFAAQGRHVPCGKKSGHKRVVHWQRHGVRRTRYGETDVQLLMGELCPQVTLVIGPAKEYAYSLVKHIRKHAGNNGMFTGIQRRLMQAFIDREKVGEAGVNLRFFIH